MGIGSFIGAILALNVRLGIDYFYLLILSFLLAGLLAFSRLKLNAHSQLQVYAALFIGIVSSFLIFFLS